jgi:hypothetical protein
MTPLTRDVPAGWHTTWAHYPTSHSGRCGGKFPAAPPVAAPSSSGGRPRIRPGCLPLGGPPV